MCTVSFKSRNLLGAQSTMEKQFLSLNTDMPVIAVNAKNVWVHIPAQMLTNARRRDVG